MRAKLLFFLFSYFNLYSSSMYLVVECVCEMRYENSHIYYYGGQWSASFDGLLHFLLI